MPGMIIDPVSREGLHRPGRVQSLTTAGRAVTGIQVVPVWARSARWPASRRIVLVFVDRGWPRFNEAGYFEPLACGI
jgi:hypothetical protein